MFDYYSLTLILKSVFRKLRFPTKMKPKLIQITLNNNVCARDVASSGSPKNTGKCPKFLQAIKA